MFDLDFFHRGSSLMGTTVRAVPSKRYVFSTNYQLCIAIPTWFRCSPPILFWNLPTFNLFLPRSCAPTCSTSICVIGKFLVTTGACFLCKAKKQYVCFRFPDRLTIFSPIDSGFFYYATHSFLLGIISKKNEVDRTTLREVMRFWRQNCLKLVQILTLVLNIWREISL